MRERWTAEQAWDWYKRRPWVMGVNYVPSITLHAIELWQKDTYPEDYGSCEAADVEPVQRLALDESDIITFHQYEGIERVKRVVSQLKKENRPMMNTEWLNRVQDNFIQDNLPLYYEEGIGSYSWGLVAGKSQHFLPWDELWNHRELPLNRWQHDLFDTFFTAYDEEELELMRTYRKKSEESCQRKE